MSILDLNPTPEQLAEIEAESAAYHERVAEWLRTKATPLPGNVVALEDWKRERRAPIDAGAF